MMKKIHAVSLLGRPRVEALAVYDGQTLVIQSLKPITGFFGGWRDGLLSRVADYTARGFLTLVEEHTGHFTGGDGLAQPLLLGSVDRQTGRTWQNIALDYYYALTALGDDAGNRRGNLVLNKGLERHFLGSNINIEQDDKGRNKYDVEQDAFSGYHRALLLCVAGALCINQPTEDWVSEFTRAVGIGLTSDSRSRLSVILDGAGRALASAR